MGDTDFRTARVDNLPGSDGKFPDGTFLPVTQTINPLSDIPTDDHKMLIIRLELDYVEYGHIQDLLGLGVESMRKRLTELRQFVSDIEAGTAAAPHPMSLDDVRVAASHAASNLMGAEALVKKTKRPPPR